MSINQDITNLPTPPNRSDSPSDFSDKADAFLAALPTFQTELNTYADEANTTQTAINTSETNAADAAQSALEWASKIDGIVDTTDYSAKAYAIGGTGVTDVTGAAKEWAVKSGVTVDGTEYSAKDWASSENLITEGSAKDWANEAAASASAAASTAGAVGWSAGTTYNTNDAAIGSDGNTYRSLIDNNTGNDPVTGDGTKWLNLTGTAPVTKAELTKTFAAGESASLTLSEEVTTAPVVSVTKEVPQTGVTNNDWDVAADGSNFTLHDTAYDTTLTPGEIAFAIGSASYDNVSFSVSGQETAPLGIAFNTDGTKMYISGASSDSVHQYSLSTAFDLSTASYDSVSFDVSAQDTAPQGITFNTDGTKMYMVGANNDSVHQYTLSTGFDLSTASYDNVSFSVSGQDTSPQGITFNTDGTKMYMVGRGNDSVYQYTLSTSFDLSTASYDNVSFDVSGQDTSPSGIRFNTDGTKMYMVGYGNDSVHQYTLSTAFDLSTASYDSVSFDVSGQDGNPLGIAFNTDGAKMYMVGQSSESVHQYSTSKEALILGTGSFAAEDVGKRIVGNGGEAILTAADGSYELQTAFNDTSTIAAGDWSMFGLDVESADAGLTLAGISRFYDIDSASYDSVSLDVSGQDGIHTGITFNTDGTKMYMVGATNDSVYQYTLNTAFDLSTASYDSVSFEISGQDTSPQGITFNNDGTKMYMVGQSSDSVHQYTLNTAFDLSTASYDSVSFDVSGQDGDSRGIAFNTDGTKMYIIGNTNDSVYQYTLSTAFDISTASYDNVSFDVSGQDGINTGIIFNKDGTKMYIVGSGNDSVYQYTLSTAFDISTASYDNVSFDVSGQDGNPTAITFNNDGTKMYMVGYSSDSVHQYTTTSFVLPTNTNHTAVTSTSIDSEFWTDINSMTADDAVNDGAVYYAVSTDDRTTWSIIDDTNGVRNIVRNNGGTWEVNDASDYGTETWVAATENDEFYALEEAVDVSTASFSIGFGDVDTWSYDNVSFSFSSQESVPNGFSFNDDGTKLFVTGKTASIYEYTLSSPFDFSSMSFNNKSFNVSSQATDPQAVRFSNDGTKMYIIGKDSDSVFQYSLGTAYDLNTANYDSVSLDISGQEITPQSITFNDNGSIMYIIGASSDSVHVYDLSTEYDLSTATYSNVSFSVSSEADDATSLVFNNSGTKLYVLDNSSNNIYEYVLSNPFDVGSSSYTGKTLDVSGVDGDLKEVIFNNDGTKVYVLGSQSDSGYQFISSKVLSTNRMDATQLNAVSDANHYTLGNDLDLAITLFMADGNTNSPTSDGVAINYDANVKNEGAVLGTDYEFDNPTNDTVRVKALSNENFKVRVV